MNPYHRPIMTFLVIFGIWLFASLVAIIKSKFYKHYPLSENKVKKPMLIIGLLMFIFAVTNLTAGFIVLSTAIKHGATYELDVTKTPISVLYKHNNKTNNATKVKPDNPENTVVILYDYADKNYERIHKDLMTALSEVKIPKDKISFVPSKSEYGKELIALTGIYETPVAIYISPTEISETTGKYVAKNIIKYENRYPKLDKIELKNILLLYRE